MRQGSRPAFNRLFEHATMKPPTGKMADRRQVEHLILFSMLVGVQDDIIELEERLNELEGVAMDDKRCPRCPEGRVLWDARIEKHRCNWCGYVDI